MNYKFPFVLILVDVILIFISSILAHQIRFSRVDMSPDYLMVVIISSLFFVISSLYTKKYENTLPMNYSPFSSNLLVTWTLSCLALIITGIVLKLTNNYSRVWMLSWYVIGFLSLTMWGLFFRSFLLFLAKKGIGEKNVLVVGKGDSVDKVCNLLERQPNFGYQVTEKIFLGTIDKSVEPELKLLCNKVDKNNIDEVWICLSLKDGDYIGQVSYALRHSTVEMRFLPQMDDLSILNHKSSNIAGFYTIDLSCSPLSGFNGYVKRLEDIAITFLLLPLIIPICIVVSFAIKVSSKGPILFKQHRHGLHGHPIKVYKFRSMNFEDNEAANVVQAKKDDGRVTKLGKFLRKTSLDELPQFFNVLQGRMSIVGPRPHALQHNEYYKDLVESYMWRHKVKPGITGWAQVNGFRGETDTIEKMKSRVDADLWYIENWSIWLDFKIVLLTSVKVFYDKNAY